MREPDTVGMMIKKYGRWRNIGQADGLTDGEKGTVKVLKSKNEEKKEKQRDVKGVKK